MKSKTQKALSKTAAILNEDHEDLYDKNVKVYDKQQALIEKAGDIIDGMDACPTTKVMQELIDTLETAHHERCEHEEKLHKVRSSIAYALLPENDF